MLFLVYYFCILSDWFVAVVLTTWPHALRYFLVGVCCISRDRCCCVFASGSVCDFAYLCNFSGDHEYLLILLFPPPPSYVCISTYRNLYTHIGTYILMHICLALPLTSASPSARMSPPPHPPDVVSSTLCPPPTQPTVISAPHNAPSALGAVPACSHASPFIPSARRCSRTATVPDFYTPLPPSLIPHRASLITRLSSFRLHFTPLLSISLCLYVCSMYILCRFMQPKLCVCISFCLIVTTVLFPFNFLFVSIHNTHIEVPINQDSIIFNLINI